MAAETGHDLFISYQRADRELVASVARKLEARGVSVWYDAAIDGGAGWRETAAELGRSDILAVFFSDACNQSSQLNKELALADTQGKPVAPILIEDAQPRGPLLHDLADRRWIEAWPDPAGQVDALVDHLAAIAGKPSEARPEPIESSYDPTTSDHAPSRRAADYSGLRGTRRRGLIVLAPAILIGAALAVIAMNQFDFPATALAGLGLVWAGLSGLAVAVYGVLARRRAIRAFRSNLKKL